MTAKLRTRVAKLAKRLIPDDERGVTMEHFCRFIWRTDKRHFMELAQGPHPILQYLIPQYENEDAERDERNRRRERRRAENSR